LSSRWSFAPPTLNSLGCRRRRTATRGWTATRGPTWWLLARPSASARFAFLRSRAGGYTAFWPLPYTSRCSVTFSSGIGSATNALRQGYGFEARHTGNHSQLLFTPAAISSPRICLKVELRRACGRARGSCFYRHEVRQGAMKSGRVGERSVKADGKLRVWFPVSGISTHTRNRGTDRNGLVCCSGVRTGTRSRPLTCHSFHWSPRPRA
jgi:hypothetical protein